MKKNQKLFLIALIIIGGIGAILFFPVKMESGKTCVFHFICDGKSCTCPENENYLDHAQLMIKKYLMPFGFFWWLSLSILGLSIYRLRKLKTK